MGPLILVVIAGMACLYLILIRESKVSKFAKKYYGPPRLPILGSALAVRISDPVLQLKVIFGWLDDYGPRFCASLGPLHFFVTECPEDVEKVLKSTTNLEKGKIYTFLEVINDGLPGISGSIWPQRRKMLNPSFHWTVLQSFQSVFDKKSQIFLSLLKRDHCDGRPFDIVPYLNRLALDIICETAMGVSIGCQDQEKNEYLSAVEGISELSRYRAQTLWLYPDLIWKHSPWGKKYTQCMDTINALSKKVIMTKKAEIKLKSDAVQNSSIDPDDFLSSKKSRTVFINLLLSARDDEGNGLTDKDVLAEVNAFIFAGNDTTAPGMSWCSFILAGNPLEQEKIIDELNEIFGDDKTRPVTTEDLGKMKYLECCIKESFRIRSPTALLMRKLTEDMTLHDGLVLPAGINIMLPIYKVHKNLKSYPEPEKYKPERWLPENSIGRHPYTFLSFSQGPRNCIGQRYAMMEMKTVMANLLRNFRLETNKTIDDIFLRIYGVVRPGNPLPIILKKR